MDDSPCAAQQTLASTVKVRVRLHSGLVLLAVAESVLFSIFPVPEAGQLPKYFADDGTAKKKQVEVQAEALGLPEVRILQNSRLDSSMTEYW